MQQGICEVEILINGKPAKEFTDYNSMRTFIEGREGTDYSIRVKNNSSYRICAVVTVDGVSVMDGKSGSFDSQGYLLDPWASHTIDGWRTSLEEVAKFVFSNPEKSYATTQGQSGNQGIIGVAVFKEKTKTLDYFYYSATTTTPICKCGDWCRHHSQFDFTSYSSNVQAANMSVSNNSQQTDNTSQRAMMMQATSDLGTAFGEAKTSKVREVTFTREESPHTVLSLYYATRAMLEAMGIQVDKPLVKIESRAFPSQFCPPPTKKIG